MNFKIAAAKPLSILVRKSNILFWEDIVTHIQHLPYGRNANRYDLSLAFKEQKGTCSSKHAFLAELANENNIDSIQLVLGMYQMNSENTNIGNTIANSGLDYIPEAHCYLKIDQKRLDITSSNSSFEKIQNVLLKEIEIRPKDVAEYKVAYHKKFLKKWLHTENIPLTFDDVWNIREQCIAFLSKKSTT